MPTIAVSYSPEVGGSMAKSFKKAFATSGSTVINADYRQMMSSFSEDKFAELYSTQAGRMQLFAHAKAMANEILNNADCLALSGNSDMIDPQLFNRNRVEGEKYDLSRTIAELALLHVATQRGMPILGVCGGQQVMSVYNGGELRLLTPEQIQQQQFRQYSGVTFDSQSLIAQIISGKPEMPIVATTKLEEPANKITQEFFGSHSQVAHSVGEDLVITGNALDDSESIESVERVHGAPTIGLQFHPEVSIHGRTEDAFFYKKSGANAAMSKTIFDFFHQAAKTYRAKQNMLLQLKSFSQAMDEQLIAPSSIKNSTSGTSIDYSQNLQLQINKLLFTISNLLFDLYSFVFCGKQLRTERSQQMADKKSTQVASYIEKGQISKDGRFFSSLGSVNPTPSEILRELPAKESMIFK